MTPTPHSTTVSASDFDSEDLGSNPNVAAILSDLLAELTTSGWTISWAFQYAPDEWRMTIIREADVGAEQGTYTSHCAIAPTFHSALEDCLTKRNDATFEPTPATNGIIDKSKPKSFLDAIGLQTKPKVERRI